MLPKLPLLPHQTTSPLGLVCGPQRGHRAQSRVTAGDNLEGLGPPGKKDSHLVSAVSSPTARLPPALFVAAHPPTSHFHQLFCLLQETLSSTLLVVKARAMFPSQVIYHEEVPEDQRGPEGGISYTDKEGEGWGWS